MSLTQSKLENVKKKLENNFKSMGKNVSSRITVGSFIFP